VRVRFQFGLIVMTGCLLGGSQVISAQDQAPQATAETTTVTATEVAKGHIFVSYENGQLTIKANNVPLLAVVRAACSKIGAKIDAPAGSSEPVFVEMGPGPARELLTSILTGSTFNYMVEAADDDPNVVASLTVIPMNSGRDPRNQAEAVAPVVEANAVLTPPLPEEKVDPKESVAEMKDLLKEAKGEVATLGADDLDPAVRDGAARLIGMLESSMDSLAAKISSESISDSGDQPTSSAPPVGNNAGAHLPRRRHH